MAGARSARAAGRAPVVDLFGAAPEPRPLSGCVTASWHAWAKMQRQFDKAEVVATARHAAVRPIRASRQALVHAALAGRAG